MEKVILNEQNRPRLLEVIQHIKSAKNIVVIVGAGISVSGGIPVSKFKSLKNHLEKKNEIKKVQRAFSTFKMNINFLNMYNYELTYVRTSGPPMACLRR